MHSLLENDKITKLNISNNSKFTTNGFKYIAVYIKGSSKLNYLDLSYTQPDKKGIQYIMSSTTMKPSSLKILLLNGCGLRNQQLEVIATYIRKSSTINQLYLRSNKFINGGSLSIGVMLRDYDDNNHIETNLQRLYLDDNDLSQGIQYITQALKRNQSLLTLSICDCKIDSKGCLLVGEALVSVFEMNVNI
jgi:Ran GTPase-activating protein (RanGAP) involved in mRNA processing and transport